jgi:hypothetical protein
MPKKKNIFDATSDGVKAGAPGDEKPTPAVKLKKDGTPFKVRVPSGPRSVNPAIAEFIADQKTALETFITDQKSVRKQFIENLRTEEANAKKQERLQRTLQKLTPSEIEWLKSQVAKTP